ncbi:caspase family protein, partial [Bifidobacterium longum]|uniref:caspase family protein n=1 Tax=Bifidobacterium longum TaxID=216816 RepID=UPI0025702671
YDYVIPDKGRWLGKPMARCGITDPKLQRDIAAVMIDQFNRELRRMAQGMGHVAYVDCRNSVGDGNWFDELHPTDKGFAKVASKILTRIKEITVQRTGRPRSVDAAQPDFSETAHRNPGRIATTGSRAYSLHVGLNSFDPRHYANESCDLLGCENDARAMRDLAKAEGYQARVLLTQEATREAVIAEMRRAAHDLRAGDQFMFTIAGHGSRISDLNGDEAAMGNRNLDSTMCLFDGQMIDDELWHVFAGFEQGVRIVMIADTCHSGSLARKSPPLVMAIPGEIIMPPRPRHLSRSLAARVMEQNLDFYQNIARSVPHVDRAILASPIKSPIRASVLQFSACKDDQEAMDGAENGAFTSALLRVWDQGKFMGSHT